MQTMTEAGEGSQSASAAPIEGQTPFSPSEDFVHFANASLDLFCVADVNGFFRWISTRWPETLGWSSEQLMGQPFIDFVHPDDVESTLAEVERLTAGEPTIQFVNRYRKPDGAWTWLEWTTTPTPDGLLYATARDITGRMQASLDEQRRLQLLEMSVSMGDLGYWEVDLVANTVLWSEEIYAIHGQDPATFEPNLAEGIDAYHPDDRTTVQEAVQRTIEHGEPFHFEHRIVRPSGEVRQIESIGEAIRGSDGAVVRIVGVFRDLTDHPMHKRRRELEQFASLASHDLKEPLRTITTYMDLLREDHLGELEPPADEFWSFVRSSAERMSVLIDDLLLFARAGGAVERQPVALHVLVEEVLRDLGPRIEETGATITGQPALPVVAGDPSRLRHVFQNLIENALKFTDGAPRVRLGASPVGTQWEITVADDGPGIEPELQGRIFEPFKRLHRDKPGTGMGLAIVDRIVRECGGSVWVTSEAGAGATFHLVFDRG